MRRNALFVILLMLPLILPACTSNSDTLNETEDTRYVKTMDVKEESFPAMISYIGTVSSKDIKKYSFKTSGKVSSINIQTGERIKEGDVLAELDTSDLQLRVNAAGAQMDAAEAQYQKALNGAQQEDIEKARLNVEQAQDSYNLILDQYNDYLKLYDQGGISKYQLDQAELQKNNSEDVLNQARETLKQIESGSRDEDVQAAKSQFLAAKAQYDLEKNLLNDASLKSDVDGYIVDVLYKEGEMVSAGYPLAVVRALTQTVTVGMSQQDVKQIIIGNKADVFIDDIWYSGSVARIEQVPDEKTLTYEVEVELEEANDEIYIGSIAKINFITREQKGIWIDIPVIMNDGQDYVLIVENNRAVKRIVELGRIYENKVLVDGLNSGDKLIVEGIKNVKEGYRVSIVGQQEE